VLPGRRDPDDHLLVPVPVPVIVERVHAGAPQSQVFRGLLSVAELAVDLTQVQVQRGVEGFDRASRIKRTEVPGELGA